MRKNERIFLASCLAFGLAGCQSFSGLTSSTLSSLTGERPSALSTNKGKVSLFIKWPEYRTKALPSSTQAIVLSIKKDGMPVGEPRTVLRDGIKSGDNSTSLVSLEIEAGTGYTLDARAYNNASDYSEATLVATGTTEAFEIRSGYSTQVKMSLLVPNGPRLDLAGNPLGGGPGCTAILKGANFGTDKTKVQVFYAMGGYWGQDKLDVLEANGSTLKVKMPTNAFGTIKLKVLVDGVSSNAIDFQVVNDFELTFNPSPKEDYSLPGQSVKYFVKGAPLAITVKGLVNGLTQSKLNSVVYSLAVKDADGNDVTAANTLADGKIAINTNGTYTLELSSGSFSRDIPCKVVGLHWSDTPPATLTVAPYGLPGLNNNDMNQQSISLAQYYLVDGASQIMLQQSDFTWEFQPTGIAFLENNGMNQTVRFKAGGDTGITTVTATLKCDPRKSFAFDVRNVKLSALNLKVAPNTYPLVYGAIQDDAVTLSSDPQSPDYGKTLKVSSVTLSDGQITSTSDNDWNFNNTLSWSSDNAEVVAVNGNGLTAQLTPVTPGTAVIKVQSSSEPTKFKQITVNVQ